MLGWQATSERPIWIGLPPIMVFDRITRQFSTVPARYDYLTGKPALPSAGARCRARIARSQRIDEAGYTRSAWWIRRSIRSTAII
jgi:hypothetical protein